MALSPYTVTIYTKQDNPYNVIPDAPIEIRERLANGTSGSLSIIYSDQEGLIPITQTGAKADSNGQFVFYAEAAQYNAVYESQTVPVDVGVTLGTLPSAIINNLSLPYVFDTVADYKAFATAFPVGKVIKLLDRGAEFTVINGTGTANTFDVIASDGVSQSLKLNVVWPLNPINYGLSVDNTGLKNREVMQAVYDSLPSINNIFSSANAGVVKIPAQYNNGSIATYNIDTTVAPIIVDAGTETYGDKTAIFNLTAGAKLFSSKDNTTVSNQHITFRDFTVQKDVGLAIAGTVGFDLLNCSYFRIENMRVRTFEKGFIAGGLSTDAVNGGFYNEFLNNEVANCDWAIYTEFEFNSNKIIGGRYLSNKIGISLVGCSDNYISAAFEKTNLALEFGDGARGNTIAQCRFESCGRGQGGGGVTDLLTGGAIYFGPGSSSNTVIGGHYSGAGDKIIDEGLGNIKIGATQSAGGLSNNSSLNLFGNPTLDVDSDGDGLADGLSSTVTTGFTWSIDPATKRVGNASQKLTVDPSNATRRDVSLTMAVQIGNTYTVSALVKTDSNAAWNLRVGKTLTGIEFSNFAIAVTPDNGDGFNLVQVTFLADDAILAGQEFIYINFFMNSGTVGTSANLWIDYLGINQGVGTSFENNNIVFNAKAIADVQTANVPQGTAHYLPEVDRPAFLDSQGKLRNFSGREVVGKENNIDAASTITLPAGRNNVIINTPGAATNVDDITTDDDAVVTLIIPSSDVTITDGGNKRLNGDFVGGSNDALQLACIGTVWYEVGRSLN